MILSLNHFGGMAPIINPRKLPDAGAQVANWAKFDGTDLRPWRDAIAIEYEPGQGTDIGSSGNAVTSLYRFSVFNAEGAFQTRRWLGWVGIVPVDPVPSPIPADQYMRLYWTVQGSAMQVASSPTMSMTLGNTPGPRAVGIPAPIVKPVGVPVDDSALTSLHPLEITQAKPAVVTFQTPPDQPFTEGQQVQIVITTPEDATEQNMRELSGKTFLAGNVTATTIELRNSDTSNYSEFVDPSAAIVSAVYSESDFDDRVYVFTLVSEWGEEGPPSPPSDVITVRKDGGKVTVTLTWARPNGYDHIMKMRVYRTLTGEDGTRFFFVKDISFSGGSPSVPAIVEFVDDVDPIKIGEIIPSTEWTAPVSGMFCLTAMPNGFMVAFKGNTVYACEAYQPHAWPDRYRKTLDSEIIGAASMGQSVVVATGGKPYLLTGSDPASLTATELPVDAPCLSLRSIISVGSGVVYATHDGLAYISGAGASIITQGILSKSQWAAIWSGTAVAGYHDGRYFVISSSGSFPTFSLRISDDGELQYTTYPSFLGRACAIDSANDSLCFIGQDNGGVYRRLFRMDAALTFHSYTWTSKVFTLPSPANFAFAQVFATTYPVTLLIQAAKPVSGGTPGPMATVVSKTVSNSDPFILPSGFTAREWQFTFTGTAEVQRMDIATTMAELRTL